MARRYGERERFAIEIGDLHGPSGGLQEVDVYAANRWLTCDDNVVLVSCFVGMLKHDVGSLLRDASSYRRVGRPHPDLSPSDNHRRLCADAETDNDEYLAFRFMDWGPTADNVRMHLFREGDTAILPFSFWRESHHEPDELGQVFVAELPWRELAGVLHEAAWELVLAWANRSR